MEYRGRVTFNRSYRPRDFPIAQTVACRAYFPRWRRERFLRRRQLLFSGEGAREKDVIAEVSTAGNETVTVT